MHLEAAKHNARVRASSAFSLEEPKHQQQEKRLCHRSRGNHSVPVEPAVGSFNVCVREHSRTIAINAWRAAGRIFLFPEGKYQRMANFQRHRNIQQASILMTPSSVDSANSRHWLTTCFLQPLPCLFAPQASENCQLTDRSSLLLTKYGS